MSQLDAVHSTGGTTGAASTCILCGAEGPLAWARSDYCQRCYRDLIAGFHRRREAARDLCPLPDGTRDPLSGWAV
jgi:hypothetical protein